MSIIEARDSFLLFSLAFTVKTLKCYVGHFTGHCFQDLCMLASQLSERYFLNFQQFGVRKKFLMENEEEEEKIPLTLRRGSSLRLSSRDAFKGMRDLFIFLVLSKVGHLTFQSLGSIIFLLNKIFTTLKLLLSFFLNLLKENIIFIQNFMSIFKYF